MSEKINKNKNPHHQNREENRYHPNGMIEFKILYKNDKKHGLDTWWYDNGKKEIETMWKDGKKHGPDTVWWENGNKRREYTWNEGAMYGMITEWYESGRKAAEIYLLLREEYGRIKWDEKGNITKTNFPTLSFNKDKDNSQIKKIISNTK